MIPNCYVDPLQQRNRTIRPFLGTRKRFVSGTGHVDVNLYARITPPATGNTPVWRRMKRAARDGGSTRRASSRNRANRRREPPAEPREHAIDHGATSASAVSASAHIIRGEEWEKCVCRAGGVFPDSHPVTGGLRGRGGLSRVTGVRPAGVAKSALRPLCARVPKWTAGRTVVWNTLDPPPEPHERRQKAAGAPSTWRRPRI
jgi:hypothetical protein